MIGLGIGIPRQSIMGGGGPGSPPNEIPGLFSWQRADNIVVSGSDVTDWPDKSGNSHNVVQATGSLQPDLDASDSLLNNEPSVVYDGADDMLASDEASSIWSFLHNGAGATVGIVFRIDNPASAGQNFLFSTLRAIVSRIGIDIVYNTGSDQLSVVLSNGTAYLIDPGISPPTQGAGAFVSAMTPGSKNVLVVILGASSYTIRLNGAVLFSSVYNAAPSASAPFGTLHVGHIASGNATESFGGAIAEVVTWNRPLLSQEASEFEIYAKARYLI